MSEIKRSCATTIKRHSSGKMSWETGLTGEDAKLAREASNRHKGRVSGVLGFNGSTAYEIIEGVVFETESDREAFLSEFGERLSAKATDAQMTPGIDRDDINF